MAAPSVNYLRDPLSTLRHTTSGVSQWKQIHQLLGDRIQGSRLQRNADNDGVLQSLAKSIMNIDQCLVELKERKQIPDRRNPTQQLAAELILDHLRDVLMDLQACLERQESSRFLDKLTRIAKNTKTIATNLREAIDFSPPAVQVNTDINNNVSGVQSWFKNNNVIAPTGVDRIVQQSTVKNTTIRGTGSSDAHSHNRVILYESGAPVDWQAMMMGFGFQPVQYEARVSAQVTQGRVETRPPRQQLPSTQGQIFQQNTDRMSLDLDTVSNHAVKGSGKKEPAQYFPTPSPRGPPRGGVFGLGTCKSCQCCG